MWLLSVALAADDDLQSRVDLYDALLSEALTGDVDEAARRYQSLARRLPVEDVTRAEALLWLGRALYDEGEVERAREALLDGIRSGLCPTGCRDLLEIIDVDQESITRIPTTWTFDETNHGVFHPWVVQDLGAIALAVAPDGDPALEWTTTAQARKPDRLEVGFREPFPAPSEVRIGVTSSTLDALLQVVVLDEGGRRYLLPDALVVRPGERRRVVVDLNDLQPVDAGARPLEPGSLWRLLLVDVTGNRVAGPNTLWLHDFEVK